MGDKDYDDEPNDLEDEFDMHDDAEEDEENLFSPDDENDEGCVASYDAEDDDEDIDSDFRGDDESRISELEELGYYDGQQDANSGTSAYTGFGLSVDEDELSEEEHDAYENGYLSGYQSDDND